jgi:glycosyltransferase involved in cell wall biosynthesis
MSSATSRVANDSGLAGDAGRPRPHGLQLNEGSLTVEPVPQETARLKVLIVSPYFYPRVGGLENYVRHISRELSKMGWAVSVVCGDVAVRTPQRDSLDGCTVYRLPVWKVISNTPVHLGWYRMLKQIIKTERPDVINANAPVPYMADMIVLAARQIPVVMTYHAGSMRKDRLTTDWAIRLYESLLLPRTLNRATRIICSSDFIRDHFLRAWRDKSVTIMPGVDTECFVPGDAQRERQGIVFVGDFRDPRKGLDVLLEAVRELPDVRVRIVGPGDPRPQPRVEFLGVKYGEALVRELQRSQALVLPSTTEAEGFGMVLIEAMACATPVIASDIGGIALAVRDGVDGVLVPPGDPIALRRAITELLGDPARISELGAAGRDRTERLFTWSDRGQATDEALRAACLC